MKLQDLDSKPQVEQSQKVFESYFKEKVNFTKLSEAQAKNMLVKVRGLINEHRNSKEFHNSETNPNYLKLMVMERGLSARVKEDLAQAAMKDPATKRIVDKAKRGQRLTPDEQQTMNAIALSKTESKVNEATIMEAEVEQAQVVLAAQDMVDRIQKMYEDINDMRVKDLPALADSIKGEIGVSEAQSFADSAGAALDTLTQNLADAKTALEGAQGVLTGQEAVVPGEADDEIADLEEPAMDTELDAGMEDDDEAESDLEASLGRARR